MVKAFAWAIAKRSGNDHRFNPVTNGHITSVFLAKTMFPKSMCVSNVLIQVYNNILPFYITVLWGGGNR